MQLHVGKYFSNTYEKIKDAWHTNSDGNYWTGWMPSDLPPIELYKHAVSIINDLFVNHPELRQEMMNILIQNQLPKDSELQEIQQENKMDAYLGKSYQIEDCRD